MDQKNAAKLLLTQSKLQGDLPKGAAGVAGGLKLDLRAIASQIPRAESDLRRLDMLFNQTDLAFYSQNSSWTQHARNGSLGVYVEGSPNQLFTSFGTSNITVSVNGSLYFQLAPNRHGLVLFQTRLQGPVDTYFKCRSAGSSSNSTAPQDFLFLVVPVNDQPTFRLASIASAEMKIDEDVTLHIEHFALDISNGGWNEQDQVVSFVLIQTSGVRGLFSQEQIECTDGHSKPCTSGNARLVFKPNSDRYGSASYSLMLKDSGGTERGGIDTSVVHTFSIRIWPKNDAPSFYVSTSTVVARQDTACTLGASTLWVSPLVEPNCVPVADPNLDLIHVHAGFAANIDMGPYENGPLPGGGLGLSLLGICSSGPCEHQTGTFIVEPIDTAQADNLLKSHPIITAKGALKFEARWLVTGQAQFRVRLVDSGTVDISVLPSPRMDPAMYTILADRLRNGVARKCEDWHSATFCNDARVEDRARLAQIAVLSGDSAMSSVDRYFSIQILAVNRPPSFIMLGRVDVLEDSGTFSGPVIINITTDNTTYKTEPDQRFSFSVATNYSQMFTLHGAPKISADGRLEFTAAPDMFGPVELYVTLKDNGGTDNGGRDYSETSSILVVVDALNDAPFFQYEVRDFELSENAQEGSYITMFTQKLDPGPLNEMCATAGPYCIVQKMQFRVVDIDNPTLFAIQPNVLIDSSYITSLSFSTTPGAVGDAIVTFRFEDDGQNIAPREPDVKITSTSFFRVRVFASNDPPSFKLPFAVTTVSCDNDTSIDRCSCSVFDKSSTCVPVEDIEEAGLCQGAHVQLVQSFQGQKTHVIHGFAAGITPAYGYQPSSLTLFGSGRKHVEAARSYHIQPHQDAAYGRLGAQSHGADPLGSIDMQLAVDTAISPDGRYMYATETETDSVSVHLLTADGALRFADRRTNGERRLRFLLPQDATAWPAPPAVEAAQNTTNTTSNKCIFKISNSTHQESTALLQNVTVGLFGVKLINGSWVNCSDTSHDAQKSSGCDNVCKLACAGRCVALTSGSANYSRCVFECGGDPTLNTTFVCGIEVFKSHAGRDTFVVVASGCESMTRLATNFLSLLPCQPATLTAECGYECCMAIENGTVGLWDFTEYSISGATRRPNAFQEGHTIRCGLTNCSYSRLRNGDLCSEHHDTWFYPPPVSSACFAPQDTLHVKYVCQKLHSEILTYIRATHVCIKYVSQDRIGLSRRQFGRSWRCRAHWASLQI